MPAIYNDEIIIPILLEGNIHLEDARNYALAGYVEPSYSGEGLDES